MQKVIEYKFYTLCHAYGIENDKYQIYSYYDEPSYIELHSMGCYYSYYRDGTWHREDGPARMWYTSRYVHLIWYYHGIIYKPKCQKL